jgi:hypothetical protein
MVEGGECMLGSRDLARAVTWASRCSGGVGQEFKAVVVVVDPDAAWESDRG